MTGHGRVRHTLRSQTRWSETNDGSQEDTPNSDMIENNGQSTQTAQGDVASNNLPADEDQQSNPEGARTPQSDLDLQAEYERLKKAQTIARLRQEIDAMRAEEATGFQLTTAVPYRPRDTTGTNLDPEVARKKAAMDKEKLYPIKKPNIYHGKSTKELNTFILECNDVFEVRPVTYEETVPRIQLAKGCMGRNPYKAWHREQTRLANEQLPWPSWKEFIEFLTEQVSLTKLQQISVAEKIKKLQQRPGQTVHSLIAYLDTLEGEWSETLPESVRIANFLTSLHEYIRDEIRSRQMPIDTRKQAHEAALLIETTVKKPAYAMGKVSKSKGTSDTKSTSDAKSSGSRFQGTKRKDSSDSENEVQGAVTQPAKRCRRNESKKDSKKEKKDFESVKCWTCHEKGHYSKDCSEAKKQKKARIIRCTCLANGPSTCR